MALIEGMRTVRLRAVSTGPDFCLIFAPPWGYDEPEILSSQNTLTCLRDADGGHDDQKGFEVLPRRWVVERTFARMTRCRRLVRDYEQRIDVSHAMILVAMGGNLIRRNAHP